jgi:hypothetical protein
MATGHVEACQLPSWYQKFDPGLHAFTSIVVGDSVVPREACASALDRIRALGVGRDGARAPTAGRGGVRALGGRTWWGPLEGSGETVITPLTVRAN